MTAQKQERENPMAELGSLSDFGPKATRVAVPPEVVEEVARAAGFPSRPVVQAAETPAEAISEPALAPAPTEAEKTAPAAAEQAAEAKKPWEELAGVEKTNLLYQMPPEIVAKMDWVIDNVPRMNKQRIVRDAVLNHLDALIAQHYKP